MNDRGADSTSGSSAAGLWRGTSRTDRDDARRGRLLDAALHLYGTSGFRATSIQALCHESGVSSRSFYELFPARSAGSAQGAITAQEALLEQLYILLNKEIVEALRTLDIPAGLSLLEATVGMVSAALMPMLGDERKARVLEVESVGVSQSLEERRRATMRLLADSVEASFAQLQTGYGLPQRDRSPSTGSSPSTVSSDTSGSGDLTDLILVGGLTEVLVQRVHTPLHERSATTDFLTQIAQTALRAHGVGDEWFDLLPSTQAKSAEA